MAQENSALIRRWFEEVWNKGRMEAIDEMTSPDVIGHGQAQHDTDVGLHEFRNFAVGLRSAFPDMKVVIDQTLERKDDLDIGQDRDGTIGRALDIRDDGHRRGR